MAWTDAEEDRIAALEVMLNLLQIAVDNLAAKEQVRQLTLLKQSELNDLERRVAALERMVNLLQEAL